ncbi:MAG: electron transfer flavoprotein subunit alpha/FixB family protein [Candidatus Binataceae bacterium]|jgi:electron transfer flavoprotein alpha subunit
MSGEVWSFIETTGGGLNKNATKMATEATRLGNILGEVPCGVLVADGGGTLADDLAPFGLQKLYALKAEAPGAWTPEAYAHALADLVAKRQPHLVLFAASAFGSEVAARVSARLGSGFISNCVDFAREGEGLVARKAVHEGRAHQTLTWAVPPPHIASVDLAALEAIEERSPVALEVIEENAETGALGVELLSRWKTDPRQLDLTEASLVVGVGRPILSQMDALPNLRDAAEKIGAVFGGSRPVADAGALPKEKQIGASGKWLTADVYIACAISGSTYHMMGIRGVRHLVAVNIDRNAPIFKHAELGIVGDMFQVIPALEKLAETEK